MKLCPLEGYSMIPIKYSYCLQDPFVDYLNITSPKDRLESILNALRPYLDGLGMSEVTEGLFRLPDAKGTFKAYTKGKVAIFGASGQFLERLRSKGLYNHYLAEFAEFEHRISMMHVTADYRIDAPKYLSKLFDSAQKNQISLTRKSINPLHVTKLLGRNLEGADTGTVYLGNRANSDVWAKVYDKRQERLAKGFDDPLPMLRVEIAVQSDINATLRDASLPREIFYHFAGKSLVEKPNDLQGWEPHADGFAIPENDADITPHERLTRIVDYSNDVTRLFNLAYASYGPDALEEIQKIIRNRYTKFTNGQVSL